MADNEEVEENTSRGNEWEVVQLTASTYAAAPGPKDLEQKDEDKVSAYAENDAEASHTLFLSGHFVFPPSQHENLPLERDNSEIIDESLKKNDAAELGVEEVGKSSRKEGDNWVLKELNMADEIARIPIYDDKGNRLPIPGPEFEESKMLPELMTKEKEKSLYDTASYSSFHEETEIGGQSTFVDNLSVPDVIEHTEGDLDLPMDVSHSPKPMKDDKYDRSKLPCEAWWKRTAASLYAQAKETNTFWSIFVAAAVMGLVILGQRWQQERSQVLQLKWHVSISKEKNGRLLGPIYRLKDVFVGGHRRGSLVRGSSSSES